MSSVVGDCWGLQVLYSLHKHQSHAVTNMPCDMTNSYPANNSFGPAVKVNFELPQQSIQHFVPPYPRSSFQP